MFFFPPHVSLLNFQLKCDNNESSIQDISTISNQPASQPNPHPEKRKTKQKKAVHTYAHMIILSIKMGVNLQRR